jgi:hypothetical protein
MDEQKPIVFNEADFRFDKPEPSVWTPEEFGFSAKRINERLTREDIYYRDNFELRRLAHNYWLCRRKVKNERGNSEYMIRFYCKIEPTDTIFANELFTKGLR